MKNRGQNKRVQRILFFVHPKEKVFRKLRDQMRGRSHKNAAVAVKNTLFAASELPRFVNRKVSHDSVKAFQLAQRKGIEGTDFIISAVGVFYFLNFCLRTENRSPVDYAANLVNGKGIRFNSKGRMDGAYAVVPPQMRVRFKLPRGAYFSEAFGYLGKQRNYFVGYFKRRCVFGHKKHLPS